MYTQQQSSHTPYWLPLGEAEVSIGAGVADGDGGALDLVAPASKVTECVDGEANVSLKCQRVDGTRINTLQCGQFLLVLLHQVSQSEGKGRGKAGGHKYGDGKGQRSEESVGGGRCKAGGDQYGDGRGQRRV